jgi:predicted acyl esterase
MAQWLIAAEQPPSLTCIAPLEGGSDFYRETLCRGGVPWTPFWRLLQFSMFGKSFTHQDGDSPNPYLGDGQQEDVVEMLDRYPMMNEYWEDKRARMDRIKVPAYILASFSTILHTVGSFRGFEEINHDEKW